VHLYVTQQRYNITSRYKELQVAKEVTTLHSECKRAVSAALLFFYTHHIFIANTNPNTAALLSSVNVTARIKGIRTRANIQMLSPK